MIISDDCLNVFISTAKDKLSNLYSKLDIGLLRLGVMSLSVNSLHLNVYNIEKKRRERLQNEKSTDNL